MTDHNDLPPIRGIKKYRLSPPLITEHAIAEGTAIIKRIAQNADHEIAAFLMLALEAAQDKLVMASKNRAHLRDDRVIFAARHEAFAGMSARAVATEMIAIANRLKARPMTEPEYSIWRIKELNGGSMPSAETMRRVIKV